MLGRGLVVSGAGVTGSERRQGRLAMIAAFAAIYVIWGSTYLAIRFAVETLPPFLMTAVRFVFAGGLMYLWARLRQVPPPPRLAV